MSREKMYQTIQVKLLNLLLSLSDALDLASPQLSQHQLRTAVIAWEIGKQAGVTVDEETHLFIAALLHDVSALTPEEKLEIRLREIEAPVTDRPIMYQVHSPKMRQGYSPNM